MTVATNEGRKGLDRPTTLEEHSNMTENTLRDHVLSGSDTTSVPCGIGESTALKVLKFDNCWGAGKWPCT